MKTHRPGSSGGWAWRAGLIIGVLLAVARPASAYTDPGSGALIWQLLVAGFVGALFYFRRLLNWSRLPSWFRKKDTGRGPH